MSRARERTKRPIRMSAALARGSSPGWLSACSCCAAGGCAGMQLKSNVREVRAIAKEARDRGAYKCAPRELALAETNVEFASHELDQGDYFRARDHVRIADRNAREAYNLALRCAPKPPGDRDHDGILDNVDKCPDEPEDKDGFEDEDGCPDPDNDKDGIARPQRQVPERARGQGQVRGRGRLPGSGQRHRRHRGRRRQVPERARGQGRVRGRRTVARIRTTTRTASPTRPTSARTTRDRPTTTAARRSTSTSSSPRRRSSSNRRSSSIPTRRRFSRAASRCSTRSATC